MSLASFFNKVANSAVAVGREIAVKTYETLKPAIHYFSGSGEVVHQPQPQTILAPTPTEIQTAYAGKASFSVVTSVGATCQACSAVPKDILAASSFVPTGMAVGGVSASQIRAKKDLTAASAHKSMFEEIGQKYKIPPALLAGIASRESGIGRLLTADGWGDAYNGYGIMQVDKRFHKLVGGPDSIDHVDQAASILAEKLRIVQDHPIDKDWPLDRQLQRAVALYNGDNSKLPFHTLNDIDAGTTGGDYSNDVWARAQYFSTYW